MKDLAIVFSVVICVALPGCVSSQSRGPQPTRERWLYKGVTNDSCAVEMAFGSPGSGIDRQAMEKTMALIERYKVRYTSKAIGREGETRMCLPLTELKKKQKSAIISELKKIAKGGQLVSVSIR